MRFVSKSIEEHDEVPLADGGRWEEIVEHWRRRNPSNQTLVDNRGAHRNASFVVSVYQAESGTFATAQLSEMVGLVEAQGDRVVGSVSYELQRADPRTLVRKGVAQRISEQALAAQANLLVIDAELSPSQTRNLEDVTGLPVCDREAVILNVFERSATTRRARLQVEIARLEYLRPRIRGIGLNMDQQMGGLKGGRGPGETESELLARRLDGRIARLRLGLRELKVSESLIRRRRRRAQRIALVGYTNAGKTSLMNALTHTNLSSRDQPFETLDSTSRALSRHGGDILVSDTVGFIRRLPDRLLSSFESTLAEVCEASLLVVVLDLSDPELSLHLQTTDRVLRKLKADKIPRFFVFNKLDRVDPEQHLSILEELAGGKPAMALSSMDVVAVAQLKARLLAEVRSRQVRAKLFIPYSDTKCPARLYASCRVVSVEAKLEGAVYEVEGEAHILAEVESSLSPTLS